MFSIIVKYFSKIVKYFSKIATLIDAKIKIVTASPKITINFKYNDMSIEMITTTITVKIYT